MNLIAIDNNGQIKLRKENTYPRTQFLLNICENHI